MLRQKKLKWNWEKIIVTNVSGAMTLVLCCNPVIFFPQVSFTIFCWLLMRLCYHQCKANEPICLPSGSPME